jgi:hypothetical protein
MKTKISIALARLNDANLILKTEVILSALTNNNYFPTPTPSLASINTILVDFKTACTKVKKDGSKLELVEKNEKRNQLLKLLNNLGLYVQLEGNDNEMALASSGFTLQKKPQPVGVLEKPKNFVVIPLYTGSIKLKIKAINGAKSYQYEYRKKTENTWQSIVNTKAYITIYQLESGVEYEFRVAGVGAVTTRVYSDIISSFIL